MVTLDKRLIQLRQDGYPTIDFVSFTPTGRVKHTTDKALLPYINKVMPIERILSIFRMRSHRSHTLDILEYFPDGTMKLNHREYNLNGIINQVQECLKEKKTFLVCVPFKSVNLESFAIYHHLNDFMGETDSQINQEVDWHDIFCTTVWKYLKSIEIPTFKSSPIKNLEKYVPDNYIDLNKKYTFSNNEVLITDETYPLIFWDVTDASRYKDKISKWSSNMEALIGNELYGLLLAESLKLPIPRTDVLDTRNLRWQFTFGKQYSRDNKKLILRAVNQSSKNRIKPVYLDPYDVQLYGIESTLNIHHPEWLDFIEFNNYYLTVQPFTPADWWGSFKTIKDGTIEVHSTDASLPPNISQRIIQMITHINTQLRTNTKGEWIAYWSEECWQIMFTKIYKVD